MTGADDDLIAVVGMAGRFPGSPTVDDYWENLRSGRELIRHLTVEESVAAGCPPSTVADPRFVRAVSRLEGAERFDAAFFAMPPREAQVVDPQHRHFLECCWSALEDAGQQPDAVPGRVGVYGGTGINSYLFERLLPSIATLADLGPQQLLAAAEKDYLTTRVSYKLGLTGPSLAVQTACSSSLVAVHLASESLLAGECDVALAGGVAIGFGNLGGYWYDVGGILSPDGHCRPFSGEGSGTVFGSGVGVVVLRRLADAEADGDDVLAVIRGSAVNNDGRVKVGFSAPSILGQAAVIAAAHRVAGTDPDDVTYVEAHGTGTSLGDPIEVAALGRALAGGSRRRWLGSVKSNLGHLDAAAGIAGFMKAVLCAHHGELVPSLHAAEPNPEIDFDGLGVDVVQELAPWPTDRPRVAGVSSFGVGGTNAHVVVEGRAPRPARPADSRWVVAPLSARSPEALREVGRRTGAGVRAHDVADVAHTLQVGRKPFSHRRAVVARDGRGLAAGMADIGPAALAAEGSDVCFLFPGQGAQRVGMAARMVREEPVFAAALERCLEVLEPKVDAPLRELLLDGRADPALLDRTDVTQPALFAVEWAQATWWSALGVTPVAALGHSVGEYVAACLAGVFDLPDALDLVVQRGRSMASMPPGAMSFVAVDATAVQSHLAGAVELCVASRPGGCVIGGPTTDLEQVERQLQARGVAHSRLHVSHAFHTAMMAPAAEALVEHVRAVRRSEPRLPFVSNVTGTWITPEAAVDPAYWGRQVREPVQLAAGVATLAEARPVVLLEVGPGRSVIAGAPVADDVKAVATWPGEVVDDAPPPWLVASSALWEAGIAVDWSARSSGERRRVRLPAYPFEGGDHAVVPEPVAAVHRVPTWRTAPARPAPAGGPVLVFADRGGIGDELGRRLERAGARVQVVHAPVNGPSADVGAIDELVRSVVAGGLLPERVVHCWNLDVPPGGGEAPAATVTGMLLELVDVARALVRHAPGATVDLTVVTAGATSIGDEPVTHPLRAAVTGAVRVLPLEYPGLRCRQVDLAPGGDGELDALVLELSGPIDDVRVALRGSSRWVEALEPVPVPASSSDVPVRAGGVYVISGGLGGIGLAVAEAIARAVPCTIVLLSRRRVPARRGSWKATLDGGVAPGWVPLLARLARMEEGGAAVHVLPTDVADRASVAAALERTRAEHQTVTGIVHSAGIAGGGVAERRTRSDVLAVVRPKVDGAVHLDALRGDAEWLVTFSSTLAHRGIVGQVDYTAANAVVEALALQADAAGRRTRCIAWDRWADVGMAAPLQPGEPTAERTAGAATRVAGVPGGRRAHAFLLDARTDWRLVEHRVAGRQVLPAAAVLELVVAALRREGAAGGVELDRVAIVGAFAVDEESSWAVVQLRPGSDGWDEWAFIQTDDPDAVDTGAVRATGRVREVDGDLGRLDASIVAGCAAATDAWTPDPGLVETGRRWGWPTGVEVGDGELLVRVEPDAGLAVDLVQHELHPGLLDVLIGFGAGLAGGGSVVPVVLEGVAVGRPLVPPLLAHVTARGQDGDRSAGAVDVVIAQADGRVVTRLRGIGFRRVDELVTPSPAPGGEARAHPPVPVTTQGLSADAGVRALFDVLRGDRTVVVVGVEGDAAPVPSGAEPVRSPRPPLGAPYVMPRDDVEQALADLWSRLLGIEPVGVDDDIFELGADSVLVVQFAARSAEAGVMLAPDQVFEHTTVAGMAAVAVPIGSPPAPEAHVPVARSDDAPAASPMLHLERRSLLALHAAGHLEGVDGVALGYLPDELARLLGPSARDVLARLTGGLPLWNGIVETPWGRIGMVALPLFASDIHGSPARLLDAAADALAVARTIGARAASLTGLLPSATGMGRAVADLPGRGIAVMTGHPATAAVVVLGIDGALVCAGRDLEAESLGVVGVGSIGATALRLLLASRPHPASIVLVDLPSEAERLHALADELRTGGYDGRLTVSPAGPSAELDRCSLLIGASSAPNAIDVARLAAGTVVVDDSYPHCFDVAVGSARASSGELLLAEGGVLQVPSPMSEVRFLPSGVEELLGEGLRAEFLHHDPRTVMGCVLSSVLYDGEPEDLVGAASVTDAAAYLARFEHLGFTAPSPRIAPTVFSPSALAAFRNRGRPGIGTP